MDIAAAICTDVYVLAGCTEAVGNAWRDLVLLLVLKLKYRQCLTKSCNDS